MRLDVDRYWLICWWCCIGLMGMGEWVGGMYVYGESVVICCV